MSDRLKVILLLLLVTFMAIYIIVQSSLHRKTYEYLVYKEALPSALLKPAVPVSSKIIYSPSDKLNGSQFIQSFKPPIECDPEKLKLAGSDKAWINAKWTCGLLEFGKRDSLGSFKNCLVYSFGVSTDSTFEAFVLENTNCEIHAFDPTVTKIGYPLLEDNPRVTFYKYGLSGIHEKDKDSLRNIMRANRHEWIDFLKIDAEGAEFEGLESVLQDFDSIPFGELMVEFHTWDHIFNARKRMVSIFNRLDERGMRLFHYEVNPVDPNFCAEYAFMNVVKK